MFPEYRELISRMKTTDRHFLHLFEKHNEIDQKVKNIEAQIEPGTNEEVEILKKEKLALKDQLYALLKQADTAQ